MLIFARGLNQMKEVLGNCGGVDFLLARSHGPFCEDWDIMAKASTGGG